MTHELGCIDVTDVDVYAPGLSSYANSTQRSGRCAQLGMIVSGWDTTNYIGGGQWIYLKGFTGCVAGTLVQWDGSTFVAAALTSTANTGRNCAVAMATLTSTQYGWFQIQGKVAVLKTAVKISPDSRVWISGTAGRFFSTATTGKQILGARSANSATIASATSTVYVYIQNPIAQGQII
jgi:hypothetical protein